MENTQQKQFTNYITHHKEEFQNKLLSEAVGVASKINDILQSGNIDLLKNAEKLVRYVVEERDDELVSFAEHEGVVWAAHNFNPYS
ncbi:hypothetical protein [Fictibacillus enclensis]|uniref:hypothetical protein n=1 Tax=Fictibacillus enclensis TaxID=1017270 RepID=UPI003336F612